MFVALFYVFNLWFSSAGMILAAGASPIFVDFP